MAWLVGACCFGFLFGMIKIFCLAKVSKVPNPDSEGWVVLEINTLRRPGAGDSTSWQKPRRD